MSLLATCFSHPVSVTVTKDNQPDRFGASLLGVDELHAKLRPFVSRIQRDVCHDVTCMYLQLMLLCHTEQAVLCQCRHS